MAAILAGFAVYGVALGVLLWREPASATKPAGTGLGLAMCYGIIREDGGVIDVDSRPGGGTAIAIRLPAVATVPASGGS